MKELKLNNTFFIEEIKILVTNDYYLYKELNTILNQEILNNLKYVIFNYLIKNN
jgi:hypothetical protein